MVKAQYIDEELLNNYIDSSGFKIGYIVEQMGISRQAFDKKRKGKTPFRAAEIFVLCSLCSISAEDKPKIFRP